VPPAVTETQYSRMARVKMITIWLVILIAILLVALSLVEIFRTESVAQPVDKHIPSQLLLDIVSNEVGLSGNQFIEIEHAILLEKRDPVLLAVGYVASGDLTTLKIELSRAGFSETSKRALQDDWSIYRIDWFTVSLHSVNCGYYNEKGIQFVFSSVQDKDSKHKILISKQFVTEKPSVALRQNLSSK
jgi:hypothetical protein